MIDISMPLRPQMPIWPGSMGLRVTQIMHLDAGDSANVSRLECDVHVGTHVDAPRHFVENGCTVDLLPLDTLIGPAFVAYLPDVNVITARDLATVLIPPGTKRLLIRTRNSELLASGVAEFRKDYVALSADASQWVVDHNICLIGIDYLSVQRYDDSPLVHEILLGRSVIILEGLNLASVQPGTYELICLPIYLVGAEGAPARAVLRRTSSFSGRPSSLGDNP